MKPLRAITQNHEIEICECLYLKNLTDSETEKVKKDLTFSNPAYETVKKYSKYAYTPVPPFITYYEDFGNGILVPIGYDVSFIENAKVTDKRINEVAKVKNLPPFLLELRDSQKEAFDKYIEANKSEFLSGSVIMPTGKGKSIFGLKLAHHYGLSTLIIVHKDDLVKGWQEDIKKAFGGKVVPGLIKGKDRKLGDFITLATVQTLNRLNEYELNLLYLTFGLVIQDEVHHSPASSFDLAKNFRARYKLGLTATYERSDGLGHVIPLLFGKPCYKYEYQADDKDILPVLVIPRNCDFKCIPLCKGYKINDKLRYKVTDLCFDFSRELKAREKLIYDLPYKDRPQVQFQTIDDLAVRGVVDFVVKDILKEFKQGHSCVVFLSQKEHCRFYYEELAKVVPKENLGLFYGDNKDNDAVLKKASTKRQYITIATYSKATEGTNVPQWEVEFLVSSLNNEKNVEQVAGRVRRVHDKPKLSIALIYDYRYPLVYQLGSHGRTRDARYRKLKFKIQGGKSSLFSRGF